MQALLFKNKQMEKNYSTFFYSGLSGLQVPIPKYLFPPPFENVSRLTYYSSLFNSIEINSSFYKIPNQATVGKWAASVTDNFKFTFKLWKGITHNKGFQFSESDVAKFLNAIKPAYDKKGFILIQLPPSVGYENIGTLDKLLNCIKQNNLTHWSISVEFRNKSWYNENTYALLKNYNAALVQHDIPASITPMINHESDLIYLRFHGPTGNYRDSYSEDFLNEYVTYINEWITEGKIVYVYFNNTAGDALNNLKTLNNLFNDKMSIAENFKI